MERPRQPEDAERRRSLEPQLIHKHLLFDTVNETIGRILSGRSEHRRHQQVTLVQALQLVKEDAMRWLAISKGLSDMPFQDDIVEMIRQDTLEEEKHWLSSCQRDLDILADALKGDLADAVVESVTEDLTVDLVLTLASIPAVVGGH